MLVQVKFCSCLQTQTYCGNKLKDFKSSKDVFLIFELTYEVIGHSLHPRRLPDDKAHNAVAKYSNEKYGDIHEVKSRLKFHTKPSRLILRHIAR